jgi:hypothetical protein
MADATIGVTQASSPDRLLDADSLTVSAQTVYRERHRIAGGAATELADVKGAAPSSGDMGLVVRQVGLAAAAAMADGTSNPTTLLMGALGFTFNGTTWDRTIAEVPTYGASSAGTVSSGTAASTTVSLGYLFHGSGVAIPYGGARFKVSWSDGAGASVCTLRIVRITAENGTPGGTSQTIQAHNHGSSASSAVFRTGATGAPTRGNTLDTVAININTPGFYEFDLSAFIRGQALEMRASTAEGWEVQLVTGGTAPVTAAQFAISGTWTEGA